MELWARCSTSLLDCSEKYLTSLFAKTERRVTPATKIFSQVLDKCFIVKKSSQKQTKLGHFKQEMLT